MLAPTKTPPSSENCKKGFYNEARTPREDLCIIGTARKPCQAGRLNAETGHAGSPTRNLSGDAETGGKEKPLKTETKFSVSIHRGLLSLFVSSAGV